MEGMFKGLWIYLAIFYFVVALVALVVLALVWAIVRWIARHDGDPLEASRISTAGSES